MDKPIDEHMVKRLMKYITEDRPARLKSYVKKYKIHVSVVKLRKGRTLLHYSAKCGSEATLRYLLSAGLDPAIKDNNGDLAVHIALHRALNELQCGATPLNVTVFPEVVQPLISACPTTLLVKGHDGKTVNELHDEYHWQKEWLSNQLSDDDDLSLFTSDSDMSEDEWFDRIADEADCEYTASWGRYEDDFQFTGKTDPDTFDAWCNRIGTDHAQRHGGVFSGYQHTSHSSGHGRKQGENSKNTESSHSEKDSFDEKLRKEREKLAKEYSYNGHAEKQKGLKQQCRKYDENYRKLITTEMKSPTKKLYFKDIPWPSSSGTVADMINIMLVGVDRSNKELYRKHLRKELIRWHPDKFLQRFANRLAEKDKDTIMSRVKEISQELNRLAEVT